MEKRTLEVNGMRYSDRELAQLIRRNMMQRVYRDKTKYSRKRKHKNGAE